MNKRFGFLVLFALSFFARADASASELDDGIASFKRNNFVPAAKCFEKAVLHDPRSINAHYYLATTYLKSQRRADAIREYETVLQLDPNGAARQYSLTALSQLDEPSATESQAQTAEAKVQQPPQPKTDVSKSVEGIGRETETRQSTVDSEANGRVTRLTAESAVRIKAIERYVSSQIANLGSDSRHRTGTAYDEMVQSIQYDGNCRIDWIKTETRKNIEAVLAEAKVRKVAYEEAALSVDRQYIDKSTSDHKLVPNLTNIYVHTYRTDAEPSGAQLPVLAKPRAIDWKQK